MAKGQCLFAADDPGRIVPGSGRLQWLETVYAVIGGSIYDAVAGVQRIAPGTMSTDTTVYAERISATQSILPNVGKGIAIMHDLGQAYLFWYDTGTLTYKLDVIATYANPTKPTEIAAGVVMLDTYCTLLNTDGKLYTSKVNNPNVFTALSVLQANTAADVSIGIAKHLNYVVAFGLRSTNFFFDASNPSPGSPLSLYQGASLDVGCRDGQSIADLDGNLFWVATSAEARTFVALLPAGSLQVVPISTPPIDRILDQDNFQEETVFAYTVKFSGHLFYVLTLSLSNVTMVYDLTEKLWYYWTTETSGVEGYFLMARAASSNSYNGATGSAPKTFMLTEQTEVVATLDETVYSDSVATGGAINAHWRTRNLDYETSQRKFVSRLEVIGDKVPSSLYVRKSDDDYQTWSDWRTIDLAANRSNIRQCGTTRRRAWDFWHYANTAMRVKAFESEIDLGSS